mgnify:CR=1 FL=1
MFKAGHYGVAQLIIGMAQNAQVQMQVVGRVFRVNCAVVQAQGVDKICIVNKNDK